MLRLVVFVIMLYVYVCYGAESKTVTINTFEVSPYSNDKGTGFDDQIVKEAFKRIGYTVNIVHISAVERAVQNVDNGVDNGTYSRVQGIESLFKNIIPVKEPISNWEAMVFTTGLNFKVNGWKSINPYEVSYISGWKILEMNIHDPKSLVLATDETNLFDLLVNNRVDLIIYEKYQGVEFINKHKLKNIVVLDQPLVTAAMYLYLNKNEAALIPRLEQALKDMKKDGTYDRIKKNALPEINHKEKE